MTALDFANLFDTPCSIEKLLEYKEKISDDNPEKKIIIGLFNKLVILGNSTYNRKDVLNVTRDYVRGRGLASSFICDFLIELLRKEVSKEAVDSFSLALNAARKQKQQAEINRQAMEEERLARQERIRQEEELKRKEELEWNADIDYVTSVSTDTARFLRKNKITYEALASKIDVTISSAEDIDSILFEYRISKDLIKKEVSIADIVGYDHSFYETGTDLLKAFPRFFDSTVCDGYHQRALSMLRLTTENAMSCFEKSFVEEPLKLEEEPDGKYTVNGNGMHRYSILRTLYLIEMVKAGGDKEKELAIYAKYKVPALVAPIDYVKTYANYILTSLNIASFVSNERDSDNLVTGRTKISLVNGEKIFLTNEELLSYISDVMRQHQDNHLVQSWVSETGTRLSQFLEFAAPAIVGKRNNGLEEMNAKFI